MSLESEFIMMIGKDQVLRNKTKILNRQHDFCCDIYTARTRAYTLICVCSCAV